MENKHKMSENRSKKETQGDGNLSQGDKIKYRVRG